MHRVAGRQNALIAAAQLRECGLSASAISRRVKSRRLFRKHRGVYAVGRPDLSQAGRFHAAVLAIGDDAVLSHRSAAALHGFWKWELQLIEVTVPRRARSRRGVRVYCVERMPPMVRRHGIPVTTPDRVVLDLAVTVGSDELFERTVHEAMVQDRVSKPSLTRAIAAHPGHPGAKRLLAEIADGAKPTRSRFEDWGVRLLRRHDFPPFETNVRPPGLPAFVEVDVLFAAQGLVIELDGTRFHDTPYRRRKDARKQALLEAAGLRVLRLAEDDAAPAAEAQTLARIWHGLGTTG